MHSGVKPRSRAVSSMARKCSFLVIPSLGFIIDPVVNWDQPIPVGPQQRNQIDAIHHCVMFARPVPMDEGNLLGTRLVERAVVHDQHAARTIHERGDLLPESGGIGFEAVQKPGEGIVGGASARRGWTRAAST